MQIYFHSPPLLISTKGANISGGHCKINVDAFFHVLTFNLHCILNLFAIIYKSSTCHTYIVLSLCLSCRYANAACELLTCDVSLINDKVGGDESLMNALYSFLEQKSALNPLLASFFSKAFGSLITRKTEQVHKRVSFLMWISVFLQVFIQLFARLHYFSGDWFPKEQEGFHRAGVETLGNVGHDGSGAASH